MPTPLPVNRASPQMRGFARRLIAFETKGKISAGTGLPATFPVPAKLGPPLAALMGHGGFRALLTRALALAQKEVPWLRAVQVKPDGTLAGLEELHPQLDAADLLEGRTVLLAQLLGLLAAFIGESLTLRLVREIYPQVLLHNLDSDHGGNHEKKK